ncbi:MAG TPA: fibrillarin-like rRNA/tRNA 2'-O-methyltransferase [Thermoplasmata archaeon]|nr:fibrillarin-like rRNA/tRNA 2'-O-methyltransferase [Thermoplasmata archaeon]
MALRKTARAGVYTDGSWLYTRNLTPGVSVYGEGLVRERDAEYRRWDANRSKLAAYLKRQGPVWPFEASTSVLYLGAGSGTTVSHLSDLCSSGSIVAIEISPRSFRDLVAVAERRPNLLPLLGDASRPSTYRQHVGSVDVLYQDVAQRDQEGIFLGNLEFLRPGGTGFLIVKSRSTDVAAKPSDVYARAERELAGHGLQILDVRTLDPFETDHAAVVARKRSPPDRVAPAVRG